MQQYCYNALRLIAFLSKYARRAGNCHTVETLKSQLSCMRVGIATHEFWNSRDEQLPRCLLFTDTHLGFRSRRSNSCSAIAAGARAV
jgi:hypothetical protein